MTSLQRPSEELRNHINELLKSLCEQNEISPVPHIEWSSRLKRVLGKAYKTGRIIRLSSWLSEDQAEETLRHELAHIVIEGKPSRPHGSEWKNWAKKLGAKPRATSASPPKYAPRQKNSRIYKGLECPSCKIRFIRFILRNQLYCRACGPRKGGLIQTVSGTHFELTNWASKMEENV
ncbi:MAG: hypothetical protein CMM75_10345 [Rhodospirillaceae bacterium]|nr:hypothetical protein [Rhodospirillaceae bacterium]